MTIEEKAKAYDEALKKMQPLYEQAKKGDNPIWSTYEYLFPQICESEDERIRKTLIEYFNERNSYRDEDETFNGVPYSSIIAYLEKQKDASKAIEAVERIDKYIDEHLVNAYDMKDYNPEKKYYCGWDDALSKIAGILQDVYSNEKQKASLKDFIDNFPYSAQKEQKSVEIHIDNPNIQKVDPNIKITTSDSSTSCNELPYMSNESYRIDYLDEKQKKQKPSERIEMKKSLSDTVITELSKYNGENYWKSPWAMDSTGLQYPLYFANLGATWQKEQKPAEQLGGTFTSYDIAKTFTDGQNYVIAHPEKFGLCKPAEWSEEDKGILLSIKCVIDSVWHNFHYDCSKEELKEMWNWLDALWQRVEYPQLKQEWSEKDEYILKNIYDFIKENTINPNRVNCAKECLNWLKFLPERFNLQPKQDWSDDIIRKAVKEVGLTQHQIDWFKTNVFPPKQEWSDEDETRLTNTLIMLKEYTIHHYSKDDVNKSVDWLEKRFKSLRPQPHWKPSEEQMDALKDVAYGTYQNGDGPALRELYEQLKKLI